MEEVFGAPESMGLPTHDGDMSDIGTDTMAASSNADVFATPAAPVTEAVSESAGTPIAVETLAWPVRGEVNGHNGANVMPPFLSLPLPSGVDDGGPSLDWLGLIVLAPHFQPSTWAIMFDRRRGVDGLLADVLDLKHAIGAGFCDSVAPIRPQRHRGYAMVVAFPSVVLQFGPRGHVPVVMDISRAGGHYFATILPSRISYDDIETFILPHTSAAIDVFRIFVGGRMVPAPFDEDISLEAGDVITVLQEGISPFPFLGIDHLLEPGLRWSPLRHIPREFVTPGFCVTFEGERFVLYERHVPGRTVLEAVSRLLDLQAESLTCSFSPLADLDVQGSTCSGVLQVARLPNPTFQEADTWQRRDVFVLCDLRGLGLRPISYFSHSLAVHVPSVFAYAKVRIPAGYEVVVKGGRLVWPDVYVHGSTTLAFSAVVPERLDTASEDPPSSGGTDPASDGSSDDDDDSSDGRQDPPEHRCTTRTSVVESCDRHPGEPSPVGAMLLADDLVREKSITQHWQELLHCDRMHKGQLSRLCVDLFAWCMQPRFLRYDRVGDLLSERGDSRHLRGLGYTEWPWDATPMLPPTWEQDAPITVAAPPQQPRTITFLIFKPDYCPETVQVAVAGPHTLEAILDHIAEVRDENYGLSFPDLCVVARQPSRAVGALLAFPPWAHSHTIVLFDCRFFNGTAFALSVSAVLRREDILVLAGQAVELHTGDVITLVTFGELGFWVLVDYDEFRLPLPDGGSRQLRVAIAEHMEVEASTLTIRAALPRAHDHSYLGWTSCAVLVATTNICRTMPRPFAQTPIVIDLRRILHGIEWRMLETDRIAKPVLLRQFRPLCPDGYAAVVTGGRIEVQNGDAFCVCAAGQVLRVEFVADLFAGERVWNEEEPENLEEQEERLVDTPPGHREDNDEDRSRSPRGPGVQLISEEVTGLLMITIGLCGSRWEFLKAMMLACTLLEVLFEQAGGNKKDPQVAGISRDACTLKLDELLPSADVGVEVGASSAPEMFQLDVGQCLIPVSASDLDELLAPVDCKDFAAPPDQVPDAGRFASWVDLGAQGFTPGPDSTVVITSDGSFSPDTGQAGWAVVISVLDMPDHDFPGRYIGCFFGSLSPLQEAIGPAFGANSPYLAELAGLFWGALLALRLPVAGRFICRADNQAALFGASGSMRMRDHPLGAAVASLHLSLQLMRDGMTTYDYVAGHSGDPANELADGLAALGARDFPCLFCLRICLNRWFGEGGGPFQWLPHLCMQRTRPDVLPGLQHDVITWSLQEPGTQCSGQELMAPFLRAIPRWDTPKRPAVSFAFCCVTFNALSLLEPSRSTSAAGGGLHGAAGRVGLLAQTLQAQRVYIAGLQETRTPRGTRQQEHFVRYCSGCTEQHAFGVEIWVAKSDGWPPHQAAVLHADPTRLAHSFENREAWWTATNDICRRLGTKCRWLGLLDANCRLGDLESAYVGSFQSDPQDDIGAMLHDLLREFDMWLPCSFAETMTGCGGTLYQRVSKELQRSDYVCLPMDWRQCVVQAWVEPSISAGHACMDHLAAIAHVSWTIEARRKVSAPRIDPLALLDSSNEEKIGQILAKVPKNHWDTNVNEHASQLVNYIFEELSGAFPLRGRRMRASFLSAEAGDMHRALAILRHALRNRLAGMRLARLRCAFLAWTSRQDFSTILESPWTGQLRLTIGLLGSQIGELGNALRKRCRRDKRGFIESLADDVERAEAAHVHTALKKLLRPKKFRKAGPAPLPQLRKADGTMCQSALEITEQWREHFSQMEGGRVVQAEEFAASCLSRQAQVSPLETIPYQDLPSFGQVLEAFRHVNPHKTAGQDCVPPAVCKRFAVSLGLTDEDMQTLQSYVSSDPVIASEQGASVLHALTREMHAHTWFVLQGDDHIMQTSRGTRPGGCLADAMFSLLFLRVLQRRGDFASDGWKPRVFWTGKRELRACSSRTPGARGLDIQDIIYADDLATCVACAESSQLPKAISGIAGVTLDNLAEHALAANIGPRKTAALVCPAGKGAKAVREAVFTRGKGKIGVFRENAPMVSLDAVASYKHLGSCLTYNGSMIAEVRAKLGAGRAAFREGQRLIFCSCRIALRRRAALFRSHVLSVLLAGCGAWPYLCKTSWGLFERGIITMYRAMLRIPHDSNQHVSRARILVRVGLPAPQDLLHSERFLCQLVRNAPDEAWALLQNSPLALQAFDSAIDWLQEAICNTSPLGDIRSCWDEWRSLMCATPGKWKGIIKRAIAWHGAKQAALDQFETCIRKCWEAEPRERSALDNLSHGCPICKIAFSDFQAWAAHAAKTHKYKARARRFAAGVRCQACGALFSQHRRLVNHLKVTPRCCQAVALNKPGLLPPLLMPDGPAQSFVVPGSGEDLVPELEEDFCLELLLRLREVEFESDEHIFNVVCEFVEPFPVLANTLRVWILELEPGQIREWAHDVLACWQIDLLCDRTSAVKKSYEQASEDAAFRPRIVPLCLSGLAPRLPSLAVGRHTEATLDRLLPDHSPGWFCVDFEADEVGLSSFASLLIRFPAPPIECQPFWQPVSCSLRALGPYRLWLSQSVTWLVAAFAFTRTGRPTALYLDFPREQGGVLSEWLLSSAASAGVSSSLFVCFTSNSSSASGTS
ncbi:unnamed protein product [Symbiodinium sp. CCMP2592]|nr:unnamed protein product [Symbiodinium sp. CCMP2592]